MMATLPALATPVRGLGLPDRLTRAVEELQLFLRVRGGIQGDGSERYVTRGDLAMLGVSTGSSGGGTSTLTADYTAPVQPTGLTVIGGYSSIFVRWDAALDLRIGYFEVWRSSTDNIGTAVKIGQTTSFQYIDEVQNSTGHFYWVRSVNAWDSAITSAFNAVGGTFGQTAPNVPYLIETLTGAMGEQPFYQITEPTVVGDVTIPPGVYIKDAFIQAGVAELFTAGFAVIDDASIKSLDAGKITTGSMDAERIAAHTITSLQIAAEGIDADRIDSRGLSIKDAQGNVILSAGSPLDWSMVGGDGRPEDEATRNVFVGDWTVGAGYSYGDIVIHGGESWTCLEPNTAATGNAPPSSGSSNTWWALYAAKGDDGITYIVEIESSNGLIFRPGRDLETLLSARVFRNGVEVTDSTPASWFRWRRVSYIPRDPPNDDATWNALYATGYKAVLVTIDSVEAVATFHCDIVSP